MTQNYPQNTDTLMKPPSDDTPSYQHLAMSMLEQYPAPAYSCEEMGWLESLGILPSDLVTARTAVDQISWFLQHRNNLKMAVEQSIEDDRSCHRLPYELPGGKMFRVTYHQKLTPHFVEWYLRKCNLSDGAVREYSFDTFERGDHIGSRIDEAEAGLNYKGRLPGATSRHKDILKKFVREKLRDDCTLTCAALWALVFESLQEIYENHNFRLTNSQKNGEQCLRYENSQSTPTQPIRLASFEKYVTEVRDELS